MGSSHSAQPRPVSTVLIVLGYVFAIIFPLIGLILGIIAVTKGAGGVGWGIIALSVAVMVLSFAFIL